MKITAFRKNYTEYFSQKASDVTRQFAFAGIALVWIFKIGGDNPKLPDELIVPTFWFAVTLALDLFHYAFATIFWSVFCRYHEKKGLKKKKPDPDPDVIAPRWINWPTNFFFYSKLSSIVIGYFIILQFIFKILFI
jgi:hypothetical protein